MMWRRNILHEVIKYSIDKNTRKINEKKVRERAFSFTKKRCPHTGYNRTRAFRPYQNEREIWGRMGETTGTSECVFPGIGRGRMARESGCGKKKKEKKGKGGSGAGGARRTAPAVFSVRVNCLFRFVH